MPTIFSKKSPKLRRIYNFLRNQWTHPITNMLCLYRPTLSPFSNSYLRWKRTSNTCSRWNALMSTPFLLETTEAFRPLTVWWFVDDVTKLGILHAHARQTSRLQEHPRGTSITNATISPPPPHNTHGHRTPPINPPINIFAVVPIDQMTVDTMLWDILTHQIPSIPIPHRDTYQHQSYIWYIRTTHAHTHSIPFTLTNHCSPITVPPNQHYHVINTAPVTIPARTNTIMTIPCTLPRSRNYLFEPSKQHLLTTQFNIHL